MPNEDVQAQRDLIFNYLKSGGALTALDALEKFGCMRLGARVWELRHAGIAILDRWVEKVTRSGRKKRYKEYYMEGGDLKSGMSVT